MAELRQPGPGKVLDNRYIIEGTLGSGGLATVLAGRDRRTNAAVAIKVPNDPNDLQSVSQLHKETALLQRLSHPALIELVDYGTVSDMPYLVMKQARGSVYSEIGDSQSPLPTEQGTHVVVRIGGALIYMHEQGYVHLDVKPHNMLKFSDTNYQLTDLGITREIDNHVNPDDMPQGTLDYAAPEQFNRLVIPSSDQFALGRSACEILTGSLPSYFEYLNSEYPTLSEMLILVGKGNRISRTILALDAVVKRAVANQPSHRYPTMRAFIGDFEEAVAEARRETQTGRRLFQPIHLLHAQDPYQTQPRLNAQGND